MGLVGRVHRDPAETEQPGAGVVEQQSPHRHVATQDQQSACARQDIAYGLLGLCECRAGWVERRPGGEGAADDGQDMLGVLGLGVDHPQGRARGAQH